MKFLAILAISVGLFTASQARERLSFHTLANEMKPGTTVIVTDYPVVRKPVADSTYFAAN
jgi:hypothetical protein